MMGEEPLHHEVPPSQASNSGIASTHIVRSSSSSNNTPLVFDPQYSNHHHHHHQHQHHIHQQQHNNHPFDSPPWDPIHNNPIQQSTSSASSVSHSRSTNPYGTQSSSATSSSTIPNSSGGAAQGGNKTITPPRRTRHRVDAGEPRGCFNSSGLSSAGLAAAAAASHFYHGNSPGNGRSNHLFGGSSRGGGSNSAFSGGGYTNFIQPPHHQQQQQQPQHHHHPHFPQSPLHHFNQFGQGGVAGPHNQHPPPQQQPGSSPPSNEPSNYYFQPMKMLSEFISSASAVAAAQAAQQSGNSRSSRSGGPAQPHHHSQQHHQNQLLLREMLCKSAAGLAAASSQPAPQQGGGGGGGVGGGAQSQTGGSSRLNNNNIQKYGFEEDIGPGHNQSSKGSKLDGMIGLMMDKLNSTASSAVSVDEDFNDEDQESAIMLSNNNGMEEEDEMIIAEKPEVGPGKGKSISSSAGSNPEVSSELNTDEQEDDDQTSADAMDSGVKSGSTVDKDSVVFGGGASCTNNNNNNNNSKDSQSELNNKSSAADLLNNNTTSGEQTQAQTQTRNKRKKYQPQRSDLLLEHSRTIDESVVENGGGIIDEDEEEMLIAGDEIVEGDEEEDVDELIKREEHDHDELNEEENKSEESNSRRITRSQKRRMGGSGGEGDNMEEETQENPDAPNPNDIDEEEDISTEEFEARLLSSRRTNPNQAVLNAAVTNRTISTNSTRVKRKLPEDFLSDDMDEDEAMLMRQVASGSRSSAATTSQDDVESIKQEFENEEDEQEAMINDDLDHHGQGQGSRRTLPVVRNMSRVPISNHRGVVGGNIKEAPLTRQLLTTERPTSNPSTNDQKPPISLLRHRNPASSPPAGDLPNGLSNPANNFLQTWKENLKTTLMSHINELVEAQFTLLFSGGVLPSGVALPPQLQQQSRSLDQERRSLRESNNAPVPMMRQNVQQEKGMDKRTPPPSHSILQHQQQQRDHQHPPRSNTPRDQMKATPLMHLNGGGVMNSEKLQMLSSPPMNEKKLPVGRAGGNGGGNEFSGLPPRFPFMQNLQNSHDQQRPGPQRDQNGKPHFSSALVGLTQQHLQHQAVAAAAAAAAAAVSAAGIEFDSDGALSLVVNRQGGNGGGIVAEQLHGGPVTPRKKRHKVTDTRLTPRAVSRLLGQVDSTSPLYDPHRLDHSTSPAGSPSSHANNGPIEPRSILQNGTPPPSQSQQHRSDREGSNPPRDRTPSDRSASTGNQQHPPHPSDSTPRMFNPFQPPTPGTPFFHPAALAAAAAAGHPLHPHHQLGRLDSPPMGNSLLHPALQNPSEYVERLREMSMEREREQHERNTRVGSDNVVVRDRGEREHHHHHASLREYPSVRGLRDRSTGGGSIMIDKDLLELMGSRAGSQGAGSDSDRESNSAGGFDLSGGGGMYCKWSHSTSTLTPMHLRKAKLMFFWTRYPSSAVIKMYFPDIKFNKNNTAQLVKWFSNFREFYYIQMEKYARQALSEGVKNAEDLVVTTDSELYRVLNLHYNRNNHIEVPTNFRFVVEQTLREFFKSVQAGKDSEQSWKKAIYKIIARLDDPVPEYFKSPNFLEQLE